LKNSAGTVKSASDMRTSSNGVRGSGSVKPL
jgi:hypothetical protein